MTKTINSFYKTNLGEMIQGDSVEVLGRRQANTVDLIMTSPPFALIRKKEYGNVHADAYCDWFKPFAEQFHRVLKDTGSLVIDIGGGWKNGQPTRSLYHFKLLIMLCEEMGFHLAQEFYWWNPARLPTPAEWVTIRRIRVKDAINTIWWLSKTPWPKASNRRVLQPYRPGMMQWLSHTYKKGENQPLKNQPCNKFRRNNGASIPPNLIALSNTRNRPYIQYCQKRGLPVHPARFPAELPEYFVRMLTDPGDMVVDPFGGSCTTGEVCQRLNRQWRCIELSKDYLGGALGRFEGDIPKKRAAEPTAEFPYYRIPKPGTFWNSQQTDPLPKDGGKGHRQNSLKLQEEHHSAQVLEMKEEKREEAKASADYGLKIKEDSYE